ncbi:hypothetical protein SBA4_2780016 [Candidatus Sulfopaludibacter sp. SbA4]|nr:hypothetical protein SBA4_2780016 [Candidatus Sulfopaludibacter sp. SbA4]
MESFLRPLRRVVSCITRSILDVRGGYHPSKKPHSVMIGDGSPVPLAGTGRLRLDFVHHYNVIEMPNQPGSWKVGTAAYFYALNDSDDREILTYHWHPDGRSPIRFPHLHLGSGAGRLRLDLAAAHCPTGRISIEEFLRLAIVDFRVEPLRQDWADVFAEAQQDFERWRTWS